MKEIYGSEEAELDSQNRVMLPWGMEHLESREFYVARITSGRLQPRITIIGKKSFGEFKGRMFFSRDDIYSARAETMGNGLGIRLEQSFLKSAGIENKVTAAMILPSEARDRLEVFSPEEYHKFVSEAWQCYEQNSASVAHLR